MPYVQPKFYRSTTRTAARYAVAAVGWNCAQGLELAACRKRRDPDFCGDKPAARFEFEWPLPGVL